MAVAKLLPHGGYADTSGMDQAAQQESGGFPTSPDVTPTPTAPAPTQSSSNPFTTSGPVNPPPLPAGAWNPTQYLPANAPTGGYGGITYNGDPQAYVQQLISQFNLKGTQADPSSIQTIVHGLQGRGVDAAIDTRTDGLHKGIMLNGQFVKLLDGNDNWIWQAGGAEPQGGASNGLGNGAVSQGNVFDDPATQALQSLIQGRLTSLQQPLANPQMDAFLKQASEYITQLQAPVYSEPEENALRTKVFSQLEQDRATALQQAQERLSAMGHGKGSGTYEQAAQLVNKHFDQLRSQQENDLFTGTIAERQRRLQAALGVSAQAATAVNGQNATQESRAREAITTAGILPDLTQQRLALALQSLGAGGSNPSSVMSSVSQLANFNAGQQQDQGAAFAGIMDIINSIINKGVR